MDVGEIDIGDFDTQAGVAMLAGVEPDKSCNEERSIDGTGNAIEVHGPFPSLVTQWIGQTTTTHPAWAAA